MKVEPWVLLSWYKDCIVRLSTWSDSEWAIRRNVREDKGMKVTRIQHVQGDIVNLCVEKLKGCSIRKVTDKEDSRVKDEGLRPKCKNDMTYSMGSKNLPGRRFTIQLTEFISLHWEQIKPWGIEVTSSPSVFISFLKGLFSDNDLLRLPGIWYEYFSFYFL